MNWREMCEEADRLSAESMRLKEAAREAWAKEQERKEVAAALRAAAEVLSRSS